MYDTHAVETSHVPFENLFQLLSSPTAAVCSSNIAQIRIPFQQLKTSMCVFIYLRSSSAASFSSSHSSKPLRFSFIVDFVSAHRALQAQSLYQDIRTIIVHTPSVMPFVKGKHHRHPRLLLCSVELHKEGRPLTKLLTE